MALEYGDKIIGTDVWGKQYIGTVKSDEIGVVFNGVTTILTCHEDGTVTRINGVPNDHYIRKWKLKE